MTETIQTAASATLTGVALHAFEEPTGLRVTYARIAAGDLPRMAAAVEKARAAALTAAPGEFTDVVVVWGRSLCPVKFTALSGDVEALRALVLELNR